MLIFIISHIYITRKSLYQLLSYNPGLRCHRSHPGSSGHSGQQAAVRAVMTSLNDRSGGNCRKAIHHCQPFWWDWNHMKPSYGWFMTFTNMNSYDSSYLSPRSVNMTGWWHCEQRTDIQFVKCKAWNNFMESLTLFPIALEHWWFPIDETWCHLGNL